ncbi:MAG: PfkB family carbohydrate kinase, partial [Anaerococcus sp.]
EIRFKSHKVKALDTTAAGDTFLGYYLASVASGLDIEESLNLASLAAGLACTIEGAAPSIPSYRELEVYMKENKVEI